MRKELFKQYLSDFSQTIDKIRSSAHELHKSVNQFYADKPYGLHLDMVAENVSSFGYLVCNSESDIIPLLFGAYYHDSIEDARLTYHDVLDCARLYMDDDQALMATEIVYALTNDKGRTRKERAGEKYYAGIRETPFAPFVKLADRLANMSYSYSHSDSKNCNMLSVYRHELDGFLSSLHVDSPDVRFSLPEPMLAEVFKLTNAD